MQTSNWKERESERERGATCRGDLQLMAATKELTQREAAYPNVWRTPHISCSFSLGEKARISNLPWTFRDGSVYNNVYNIYGQQSTVLRNSGHKDECLK